jgi:hypothetical protein
LYCFAVPTQCEMRFSEMPNWLFSDANLNLNWREHFFENQYIAVFGDLGRACETLLFFNHSQWISTSQ